MASTVIGSRKIIQLCKEEMISRRTTIQSEVHARSSRIFKWTEKPRLWIVLQLQLLHLPILLLNTESKEKTKGRAAFCPMSKELISVCLFSKDEETELRHRSKSSASINLGANAPCDPASSTAHPRSFSFSLSPSTRSLLPFLAR